MLAGNKIFSSAVLELYHKVTFARKKVRNFFTTLSSHQKINHFQKSGSLGKTPDLNGADAKRNEEILLRMFDKRGI